MLIQTYLFDIFTPPCNPGAERFAARASLTVDISEVLPYLNASLPGAIYMPEANALTWKKGGHVVSFHAFEIAISDVEDREAAKEELQELVTLVNHTWVNRSGIIKDTSTRKRPAPMQIYQLLPNTNCKECGEATCYSFALKLAAGQRSLEECPPILGLLYPKKHAALQELLSHAPVFSKAPG